MAKEIGIDYYCGMIRAASDDNEPDGGWNYSIFGGPDWEEIAKHFWVRI
jgi:hypothetical protein